MKLIFSKQQGEIYSSKLSTFMEKAPSRQKKKVYLSVIEKAIQSQREVVES